MALRLFEGAVSRDCAFITINDDDEVESAESFTASIILLNSFISRDLITVAPSEALIIINDNETCTLYLTFTSDLMTGTALQIVFQRFSNFFFPVISAL